MDPEEFKKFAKEAIDYIVDYNENIRDRHVLPNVEPGYLHNLMPDVVPQNPEHWSQIIPDVERLIMPGMTHWNSPTFNAYFPAGNSYPSIVGEILSAGIGCVGFNWMTSPSCTELEVIVIDWLARLIGLPDHFLAKSDGPGGGVIQSSGSEGILVALITAKDVMVKRLKEKCPELDEGMIKAKLVAYSSDQSNSAIEKAGLLGSMKTRLLPADSSGRFCPKLLEAALADDRKNGFIPCIVVATLGTTATCAFDDLTTIGPICRKNNIWLHVDAAYAGAAFVCPEYRHLMAGTEFADSFNINPHKWLLVNFDCSVFWIKNRNDIVNAFTVDRIYLRDKSEEQQKWAPDFRNWEIPLGRRFRALKLWITLRLYGVKGCQDFIRKQCTLAKQFESLVKNDPRFELTLPASLGLVCFKLKGDDHLTKNLLKHILNQREMYMNAAIFRGEYFLRFAICSRIMEPQDVDRAWGIITRAADTVLRTRTTLGVKSGPSPAMIQEEKKGDNIWMAVLEESIISTHG